MTDDPAALKVAICDAMIAINDSLTPVSRDKWGPIIPPTSIDWIGNVLVKAVMATVDETRCGECGGELIPAAVCSGCFALHGGYPDADPIQSEDHYNGERA